MKALSIELRPQQRPASSEDARERVRHLVAEACEPIAQFWPMKNFVHHNPIHGLEHLPFDKAVREARHLLGGNGYLSNDEYRRLYHDGRITADGVTRALQRIGPRMAGHIGDEAAGCRIHPFDVLRAQLLFGCEPTDGSRQAVDQPYLRHLWESALQLSYLDQDRGTKLSTEVALPLQRTVGDWLDMRAGASIVEQTNDQMVKWVAAFVDEGLAGWEMPSREGGFFQAWRDLAPRDLSGRFLGIRNFSRKVTELPRWPEEAIALSLERLQVPNERWTEYLSRHLAQLPGWAGFIRWLGENPAYPGQAGHPADPVQYLAVRLFYEAELAETFCRKTWGIPGNVTALVSHWRQQQPVDRVATGGGEQATSAHAWRLFRLAQFLELSPAQLCALSSDDVQTILGWLESFPEDEHGRVWLEAYEDKYREDLLANLADHGRRDAEIEARPRAQIVFCIDVRSESMRRHVEAQGPYETYGYAGFFGVAMNHQAFDSTERFPLCPVLLKPAHSVDELVRSGQTKPLQDYASGSRWHRLAHTLFHDLKANPSASFILIDVLGFFFSVGLVGKTLIPRFHEALKQTLRRRFEPSVPTHISVDRTSGDQNGFGSSGFTSEEQANIVENGLRAIGLTRNFGRFIVLCGHGSVSDNNPYFAALHCGACGGKHGDPNARAFAFMANNSEIRQLLRDRRLDIPHDTWFIAAKHITTADRIVFYDVGDVPATHIEDLRLMMSDLEKASAEQALERCSRMPRTPKTLSPQKARKHVITRTIDWANTRPEWGLSGNAAFLIGRRSLTRRVNLHGRVFLHSYNPDQDQEGKILEKLMTAPLIVGEWINMEHYFSGVDPWFWGSGSKVIHNVVAGVGVMPGSKGDLLTGLPLQTVSNGPVHYHEPMRLLTIIEAPTERISEVIRKHSLLQDLFHNQWLNLVAVAPDTRECQRYSPDGTWEVVPLMATDRFAGSLTA